MPYVNPHKENYLHALDILAKSECVKAKQIKHDGRTEYLLRYSPLPARYKELAEFHGALLANKGIHRYGGVGYSMKASPINDWVEFAGVVYTKGLR